MSPGWGMWWLGMTPRSFANRFFERRGYAGQLIGAGRPRTCAVPSGAKCDARLDGPVAPRARRRDVLFSAHWHSRQVIRCRLALWPPVTLAFAHGLPPAS